MLLVQEKIPQDKYGYTLSKLHIHMMHKEK